MNEKNGRKLALMIREIGALTRQRISELPEGEDRDIAWACIMGAILGAGMNSGDRTKMMQMIDTTLIATTGGGPYDVRAGRHSGQ
jgi:hypothetical protein